MKKIKIDTNLKDYQGCGKVWAAIDKNGKVVGLRYKSKSAYYNGHSKEAKQAAGVTKYCKRSENAAKILKDKSFAELMKRSISELSKLGKVKIVSGIASCFELITN